MTRPRGAGFYRKAPKIAEPRSYVASHIPTRLYLATGEYARKRSLSLSAAIRDLLKLGLDQVAEREAAAVVARLDELDRQEKGPVPAVTVAGREDGSQPGGASGATAAKGAAP